MFRLALFSVLIGQAYCFTHISNLPVMRMRGAIVVNNVCKMQLNDLVHLMILMLINQVQLM
jgi:hypothetical protein